jgi:hypothetical protein
MYPCSFGFEWDGPFISDIEVNGAAHRDGILSIGDQIAMVGLHVCTMWVACLHCGVTELRSYRVPFPIEGLLNH